MRKQIFTLGNFKSSISSKPAVAFILAIGLVMALSVGAYSYYSASTEKNNRAQQPAVTPSPVSTPIATPSPTPTPAPTPKPTAKPTAKPVSSKMFKITAPTEWDTQKVTRYFFEAYAYEPIKTMTIKFDGGEFELTPDARGNFSKVFDIKVGQTVITVTAVAESGKTEVQSYTVTKGDTLSQIDPKLTGVQCDGAKLDECKNFSGYSTGKCNKYTLYLECLRTKCDVNTLAKDSNCKNQY